MNQWSVILSNNPVNFVVEGLGEDFARRGEEGDASATEARREVNQWDDPGGTDD